MKYGSQEKGRRRMAVKKKGGGGDEGGSWMDTYGDLVTLLLTFFVLLYSMSSVDKQKWDLFVRSIYPDGKTPSERAAEEKAESEAEIVINTQVTDNTPMADEIDGAIGDPEIPENQITPADINQLYLQIAAKMNEAGISGVTVSRGNGYTFVEFKDKAFFNGDSASLTETGMKTLDIFCGTIAPDADLISQINIMGHTAQADPNKNNSARNDRTLSVMRAAEVCIFIQEKNFIEPEKLVSIGYGQYRPIESNDTPEGRAANRRVEILLIDKDAETKDLDEYYKDLNSGINKDTTIVTDGNPETNQTIFKEHQPTYGNYTQPKPGEEAAASAVIPNTDTLNIEVGDTPDGS